jgi:hypothetical protein
MPLRTRTTRLFDRSTRTSMKLWKNGAWLKSNRTDKASIWNGQALHHLIQYQNGCFHIGISASILALLVAIALPALRAKHEEAMQE